MLVFLKVVDHIGVFLSAFFFFQAEDGIRDLVRSRGLGDVYKRQLGKSLALECPMTPSAAPASSMSAKPSPAGSGRLLSLIHI